MRRARPRTGSVWIALPTRRRSDRAADPAAFVHYLDAVTAGSSVQEYKRQTFALLGARAGARLLDVGCGTGDDVLALARLVGPNGQVTGIDGSETMIAEAKARLRAAPPEAIVEFRRGDAHHLDFDDLHFDGCRVDRVVQHVTDPARVLAEMVRVTSPGGRVVASEPDWGTLIVDAPDRAVSRHVLNACSDAIPNGWIGRRLPGLLKDTGLTDVVVVQRGATFTSLETFDYLFRLRDAVTTVREAGVLTASDAEAWLAGLEEADRRGRFFGSLSGILVVGRKA